MNIKISEIAEAVNGKIVGDSNLEISNLSNIQDAKTGDLTFLYMSSYKDFLTNTNASAILISPSIEKKNTKLTYIEVDKPNIAFQEVVKKFFNPKLNLNGIHSTVVLGTNSDIHADVALGVNVVIGKNCSIGSGSKIYHNTVIMDDCIIGNNALIYPNVTLREKTIIGNNIIIHSGTVIGSDGFGFSPDENGVYQKIPQIGNVIIEDDVEIGSNVSIDRAAVGSTIIHRGVKLDNLIQIAHNVKIGSDTVISAQTGISGSAKIGSNCVFGGQVGSVGHIEIADKVLVGAQSGISKSIKNPGTYFGSPAKELRTTLRLEAHLRSLPKYAEQIKTLENKISELESITQKDKEKENI